MLGQTFVVTQGTSGNCVCYVNNQLCMTFDYKSLKGASSLNRPYYKINQSGFLLLSHLNNDVIKATRLTVMAFSPAVP